MCCESGQCKESDNGFHLPSTLPYRPDWMFGGLPCNERPIHAGKHLDQSIFLNQFSNMNHHQSSQKERNQMADAQHDVIYPGGVGVRRYRSAGPGCGGGVGAQVEVVDLDVAQVAFHIGQLLVGGPYQLRLASRLRARGRVRWVPVRPLST